LIPIGFFAQLLDMLSYLPRMTQAFKALSADVLKANNQSFLQLAKTQLEQFQQGAKEDLGKRQENISKMIEPLHQALIKVDQKIHEVEKTRIGAYESLQTQVKALIETQKDLRSETSNLVTALRSPQARGMWGEIQLKRVVEMAGMLEYCDFSKQESVQSDEGRLRPDLIVRLPGKKNIIVDAKTPLAAYLEAIHETNLDLKKEIMRGKYESISSN